MEITCPNLTNSLPAAAIGFRLLPLQWSLLARIKHVGTDPLVAVVQNFCKYTLENTPRTFQARGKRMDIKSSHHNPKVAL